MSPPSVPPVAASREYLAEERTLLAWYRMAIALAGLGFIRERQE